MILGGLKKSYGSRCVLNVDRLELSEGKIYAVIGANGSGKSTFAKLAAGIIKNDDGCVVHRDVSIGYMPQKSYAFRMSTEKNLLINGGDKQRMERLLTELGISEFRHEKANRLSGGETARMALARLFMKDYGLYILDEPCSAMDIESTLLAEKLICRRSKELGCVMLIITHSVNQALRIADEVLFLSEGRLTERGEARRVLLSPEDEKTKRFLEFYGK